MNRHLKDSQILEVKNTLMAHKVSLKSVYFKYNTKTADMFIEGKGIEGIPQEESYYDNLEDNLMYAELSWLSPLCRSLNTNFEAVVEVDPSGDIDHKKVKIEIIVARPARNLSKKELLSFYYSVFKKLVVFKGFITNIEFRGHEFSLKSVAFSMELDGKKVNPLLSSPNNINLQILAQWQATLLQMIDYNEGRFKFISKLPLVNGKISTAKFESSICFKFNSRGKGTDQ